MKRRLFLINFLNGLAGISVFPYRLSGSNIFFNNLTSTTKKISFGICSDVHQDLFPNVESRLEEFIKVANEKQVDFIIQLGDFCFPREENKNFMNIWNSFNGAKYHVLGNHDMDKCSKSEILEFWGVDNKKPFYSFDLNDFHFIVLDPNNIFKNGEYLPYENGNYFQEEGKINYLTPEQLDWLNEDLLKTLKPSIIFSHQPLNLTVSNRKKVLEILEINSRKIIACFSGHMHKNWHVVENSINHVQINSMCYLWVGDKYMYKGRFPNEIQEKYPNIKRMIPYRDSLYCFVEIDLELGVIQITGKSSEFIPPGPEQLGLVETGIFGPSSSIDSRTIKIDYW